MHTPYLCAWYINILSSVQELLHNMLSHTHTQT